MENHDSISLEVYKALMTARANESDALADTLGEILELIECSPINGCPKNCTQCKHYHPVNVKFYNPITKIHSVEPTEPLYIEQNYGGYCDCKIIPLKIKKEN